MSPTRKQIKQIISVMKKKLKKDSRFLSRTIENIEKKREVAVKQLQAQAVVISSEEYVERSQGARSIIARDFFLQNSKKRNQEDVLDEDSEKNAVKKCKDTTPAPQTPENQVVADELDLDYQSEQTNDELNSGISGISGISSIYEDEDEEDSLDGSSDEEDTVELADISFNSFCKKSAYKYDKKSD
ncbi:3085_t:CDS:2 [Acaulospora morrowiae]|uniref:3085_t:CDS:1 n=1 Tax=Acaulospora morrowiae TaxID=94023 RepID=A0A9N9CFH8_9GLOM|nr:3085_t:CDS:2 [Acaulospora morrowiae]